ncbi:hypothetical protein JB92DRAFT_3052857 [Gautieria morchelliformis]|nr:hypothetical protein JB92DRAFT_3052857 [Gautieria morchelliformis]
MARTVLSSYSESNIDLFQRDIENDSYWAWAHRASRRGDMIDWPQSHCWNVGIGYLHRSKHKLLFG